MKNIAITLAYVGTKYHGWQRQKNAMTVQECCEKAVEKLTGEYSYVSGCGRTDSGVHAKTYTANFKSSTTIPIERLSYALNTVLPSDITAYSARIVPDDWDSRFSCIAKEYTYVFYNASHPSPFERERAFFTPKILDENAMEQGAHFFVGKRDFAAVRTEGTPVRSTVREVYYCTVERDGDYVYVTACADGFLYNMVRTIAGTLWYVGTGKFAPYDVDTILKSCDRAKAGPVLPPQGLYMTQVFYQKEEFEEWKTQKKQLIHSRKSV